MFYRGADLKEVVERLMAESVRNEAALRQFKELRLQHETMVHTLDKFCSEVEGWDRLQQHAPRGNSAPLSMGISATPWWDSNSEDLPPIEGKLGVIRSALTTALSLVEDAKEKDSWQEKALRYMEEKKQLMQDVEAAKRSNISKFNLLEEELGTKQQTIRDAGAAEQELKDQVQWLQDQMAQQQKENLAKLNRYTAENEHLRIIGNRSEAQCRELQAEMADLRASTSKFKKTHEREALHQLQEVAAATERLEAALRPAPQDANAECIQPDTAPPISIAMLVAKLEALTQYAPLHNMSVHSTAQRPAAEDSPVPADPCGTASGVLGTGLSMGPTLQKIFEEKLSWQDEVRQAKVEAKNEVQQAKAAMQMTKAELLEVQRKLEMAERGRDMAQASIDKAKADSQMAARSAQQQAEEAARAASLKMEESQQLMEAADRKVEASSKEIDLLKTKLTDAEAERSRLAGECAEKTQQMENSEKRVRELQVFMATKAIKSKDGEVMYKRLLEELEQAHSKTKELMEAAPAQAVKFTEVTVRVGQQRDALQAELEEERRRHQETGAQVAKLKEQMKLDEARLAAEDDMMWRAMHATHKVVRTPALAMQDAEHSTEDAFYQRGRRAVAHLSAMAAEVQRERLETTSRVSHLTALVARLQGSSDVHLQNVERSQAEYSELSAAALAVADTAEKQQEEAAMHRHNAEFAHERMSEMTTELSRLRIKNKELEEQVLVEQQKSRDEVESRLKAEREMRASMTFEVTEAKKRTEAAKSSANVSNTEVARLNLHTKALQQVIDQHQAKMEAKDREMAEKQKLAEDRITLLQEDNLMDKEEHAHKQGQLQRQLQESQKCLEEARKRVATLEYPDAQADQLLLEHTKALPEEDDTRNLGAQEWRWRAEAAEKRSQEAAAEMLILGRQLHEARQAEAAMQKAQQRSQQQCLQLQQWIDRASAGIPVEGSGVDTAVQAESERVALPSTTSEMLPANSSQEAADRAVSSELSTRKPIAHHSSSQSGNARGMLLASVTL